MYVSIILALNKILKALLRLSPDLVCENYPLDFQHFLINITMLRVIPDPRPGLSLMTYMVW